MHILRQIFGLALFIGLVGTLDYVLDNHHLTYSTAEAKMIGRRPASTEIKCPEDTNKLIAEISERKSCFESKRLAESCAWGSSIDIQIADAAAKVCLAEAGSIPKEDQKLSESLTARCAKICDIQKDDSTCLSFVAFCKLKVADFLSGLKYQ